MKYAAALLLALFATQTFAASSHLSTKDCNFGEVYAFNQATCVFSVTNTGDVPIHVSKFVSDHSKDTINQATATVEPHATSYFNAVIYSGNAQAGSRHIFHFQSNEPGHNDRLMVARGFVMTVLDSTRPMLDFGVVDLAKDLPSQRVDLTSHDVADFRIAKVKSAPSYLDVKLDPDGHHVTIKMRANAPWGYRGDYVKLTTNSQVQKEVWIGVQSNVHGEVVPSANPFNLGVIRAGKQNDELIRLTSKNGKEFRIGSIKMKDLRGTTKVEPCEPAAEGCRLIRLHISENQPVGSVIGKLLIDLPQYSQQLLLAVQGLYLAKDTKIKKLDADKLIKQRDGKEGQTSVFSGLDFSKAIENAVEVAHEPVVPAGSGPLLKWDVANEANLHGYQVFRAAAKDGPFLLVNKETIPTKSKDNSGSTYQWRDNTAKAGKTYWYYIGIVYNDGHKKRLTGPQKVVAK